VREQRSVLVTGASSGIGRASAVRLGRAGWRVFAGVRRDEDADALRREGLEPMLLDVTDDDQVAAAAATIGGRLDALVNNAGEALAGPLELIPLDQLDRHFEVNVTGQVRVTQALLPSIRAARGRIVFVGSISGRSALPFLGPYSATKHAIEAVADSLRLELRPFGVHVVLVEPGTIATPIWTKGAEKGARLQESSPAELAELYEQPVAAFRAAAAAAARRGEPPETVAETIERALNAGKPRGRYLVGKDAKRRVRLERLPDRLRDRLLQRFLFGRAPSPDAPSRRRVESDRGAERGGAR
jgi:NAD(P)-dependent dehydrogenase (short-subunit alcohol dehydrogenase family)